ncbi:Dyp-type peroxidase [Vibrio mangrovi]|uniref:Dyp-type peroxidase n=1 Tax=Vibrio mangrovi TaxID=474394 RepID=A0A1Y6IS43_9VIBR|nr:Dyp-type peroxidase [Vibrio mangrovi]MDW6001528.1 Dyp-type peroxidase [Vibrio mangrovi]SMS00448.1 putative deferrochelatase/peroxidase YfeX [Vibrio mangrovi]
MSHPQTAILPEAGPFALYAIFKVNQEAASVLHQLQLLPKLAEALNESQPGADVSLSIAFSRRFWERLDVTLPPELVDFTPLGSGDTIAPATEADFLIHVHSQRHDLLFYLLRKFMSHVAEWVDVVDETYGYRFLDARDMTGFIDGTENPKDEKRQAVALISDGEFAGGSYVMMQRFVHNLPAWERLNISAQEKVFGRTKEDSVELDDVPAASHVGRVDLKENGQGLKILRHSLPYGTVSGDHGLLFIAYCHTLHNFQAMLNSMYGESDGKTDQMLRFTRAVSGAYFFAPSAGMLQSLIMK